MADGKVSVGIDWNNNVTLTPDDATPDANNNLEISLVDDSNGFGWVFDENNPITIANPRDFTVVRVANGLLRITDTNADRGRIPTHKYTLHFRATAKNGTLNYDPLIRDRTN